MSMVYKALIYFGSCSVYLFIWFCLSKAWFKIMPPENRDDVTRMGCGPCANGQMPAEGRTVACGALPLGTRILIAGQGEFIVEDRGVSGRNIDIYMDSHAACLKKGVQRGEVFKWVTE